MSAIATKSRITPEELQKMPDSVGYELVGGELVERHASILSSRVAMVVSRLLDVEAARTAEAKVFPNDLGYQCYQDPGQIRKPDASVIRSERLVGIDPDRGYMPIPADLVVEVISPNDFSYQVVAKVREYLANGFPLIWVIHPNVRTVTIYSRGSKSPVVLGETDEITAEPALANFRCKVCAFFE